LSTETTAQPDRLGATHSNLLPTRPKLWWVVLSLLAVCSLSYLPAINAPLVFDDLTALRDNASIRTVWPLQRPMQPPRDNPMSARPIVNFTMALNFAVHGLEPWGYRAVNLLIHLANAVLVFVILRRALPGRGDPPVQPGWGGWLAWGVTLLWAVHPMQTEAVVYATQRTELMVAFFMLMVLWLSQRVFESSRKTIPIALAVGACGLGMGSKEVMFVLPILVLLYDRCFVSGGFWPALKRHGVLHVGLFATWGYLAVLLASDPRGESVGFDHGMSAWNYLCAQAQVVSMYLIKVFVPYPQLIYYDWQRDVPLSDAWLPGLGILLLLGVMLWKLVSNKPLGFVLAWFFFILAPTSSVLVIITEIAAERRMYLPMLSVLLIVLVPLVGLLQQPEHKPSVVVASSRFRCGLGGGGVGAIGVDRALYLGAQRPGCVVGQGLYVLPEKPGHPE